VEFTYSSPYFIFEERLENCKHCIEVEWLIDHMESLEPQGKCFLETKEKACYSSVYQTVILKLTHVMPSNTINFISLVNTFVVVDSITCVNFSTVYRNGTNFINKNLFYSRMVWFKAVGLRHCICTGELIQHKNFAVKKKN